MRAFCPWLLLIDRRRWRRDVGDTRCWVEETGVHLFFSFVGGGCQRLISVCSGTGREAVGV